MIRAWLPENGRLKRMDEDLRGGAPPIWVDLQAPTAEEEKRLESALGVNLPTREEMEEIEISSRLYFEDGAAFMTATLPAQADIDDAQMAPVTFVLSGDCLVTIRYHDPRVFTTFPQRAEKVAMGLKGGEVVLIALLEAIVDRLADVLERAGRDIDLTSRKVFQQEEQSPGALDFRALLQDIGRKGDLTSDIRDSLVTLERLLGFLGQVTEQRKSDHEIRTRLNTLGRDARSLADHASFLSQKITFLLDATLGMVNIEQNAIIKIFSVAAVVFLPPTLIASIYGMNFDHMPELGWPFGYPLAVALMLASAVMPFWFFKRRGWL